MSQTSSWWNALQEYFDRARALKRERIKEQMNPKIIQVEWRSAIGSVCFVAVEYGEYWQAYVGPEFTKNITDILGVTFPVSLVPEVTEHRVATHGCKLSWKEAQAFFPGINIRRYKTYPGRK